MMDRDTFNNKVARNIATFLPQEYRNADISIREISVSDGTYTGLTISTGKNIAPIINLDDAYSTYLEYVDAYGKHTAAQEGFDDVFMVDLLKNLSDIVVQSQQMKSFESSIVEDYDKAKTRLFCEVHNKTFLKNNTNVLEDCPYLDLSGFDEDVVITAHIFVSPNPDGMYTTKVTNEMLERWNVSAADLFDQAQRNGQDLFPPVFEPVSQTANTLADKEIMPDTSNTMLRLHTTAPSFGAIVGFTYEDVLDTVADRFGENYYVIPSSTHELLAVPESIIVDPDSVIETIAIQNQAMAEHGEPGSVLSYDLWYYDADEHQLTNYCEERESEVELS